MHKYIHQQSEFDLSFTIDEVKQLIKQDKQNELNEELISTLNQALNTILRGHTYSSLNIFSPYDKFVLNLENLWKRKTQTIRNDILNKYLQSENLHILMSNGCSMYAGSKAINTNEKKEHSQLLKGFKLKTPLSNKNEIEETVRALADKRPEQALDVLYQLMAFYQNVFNTDLGHQAYQELEEFINHFKYISQLSHQ